MTLTGECWRENTRFNRLPFTAPRFIRGATRRADHGKPSSKHMKTESDILNALAHFNGTESYYRGLLNSLVWTDGIQELVKQASCMWLVDVIASHQTSKVHAACDGFQLWEIKTDKVRNTAVVTCRADSGSEPIVTQRINYTDFPLAEFKLFVEGPKGHAVLLLPSEH